MPKAIAPNPTRLIGTSDTPTGGVGASGNASSGHTDLQRVPVPAPVPVGMPQPVRNFDFGLVTPAATTVMGNSTTTGRQQDTHVAARPYDRLLVEGCGGGDGGADAGDGGDDQLSTTSFSPASFVGGGLDPIAIQRVAGISSPPHTGNNNTSK